MSKFSISILFFVTIIPLISSSMVFQKLKTNTIQDTFLSGIKEMTSSYSFEDLTFNDIIYNYNNQNLIQISEHSKSEIQYDTSSLTISFPNPKATEMYQTTSDVPFLRTTISFKVTVLETSATTSGSFTLFSNNFRLQKIYDEDAKIIKPKTYFEFSFKDLSIDLSSVIIDQEFMNMILRFFCYEQEKKMSKMFNEKAAMKYINDHQIKKLEKLVYVFERQNKIDLTISTSEQLIVGEVAQQGRFGAVNGRLALDYESEYDSKVESVLSFRKEIFQNIIKDNLIEFTLTEENNFYKEIHLNMNYLSLISNDLLKKYPLSKKIKIVNSMDSITFDDNNKEYISGDLKVISTVKGEDNVEIFKFESILLVNWHTLYISEKFNLAISLLRPIKITSLTQDVRISNMRLFKKWIEGSYSSYFASKPNVNNMLFSTSIDWKEDGLITYNAYVQTDEKWISFKSNNER